MFGILTSRAIDWYVYGSNRGGGGGFPGGVLGFGGGISSFFLGHFHGVLNKIIVILSLSPFG